MPDVYTFYKMKTDRLGLLNLYLDEYLFVHDAPSPMVTSERWAFREQGVPMVEQMLPNRAHTPNNEQINAYNNFVKFFTEKVYNDKKYVISDYDLNMVADYIRVATTPGGMSYSSLLELAAVVYVRHRHHNPDSFASENFRRMFFSKLIKMFKHSRNHAINIALCYSCTNNTVDSLRYAIELFGRVQVLLIFNSAVQLKFYDKLIKVLRPTSISEDVAQIMPGLFIEQKTKHRLDEPEGPEYITIHDRELVAGIFAGTGLLNAGMKIMKRDCCGYSKKAVTWEKQIMDIAKDQLEDDPELEEIIEAGAIGTYVTSFNTYSHMARVVPPGCEHCVVNKPEEKLLSGNLAIFLPYIYADALASDSYLVRLNAILQIDSVRTEPNLKDQDDGIDFRISSTGDLRSNHQAELCDFPSLTSEQIARIITDCVDLNYYKVFHKIYPNNLEWLNYVPQNKLEKVTYSLINYYGEKISKISDGAPMDKIRTYIVAYMEHPNLENDAGLKMVLKEMIQPRTITKQPYSFSSYTTSF